MTWGNGKENVEKVRLKISHPAKRSLIEELGDGKVDGEVTFRFVCQWLLDQIAMLIVWI